ncbi:MAG: DNA repair protein RecO, partial [Phycisphaerae bacterium]|nr:DNA repair protein RecO [Phycisphaerae bacterium]
MPSFTDSAICIRKLDWSETSQIVVLMTEGHGKVSATAKGAKRQSPSTLAKFSGGIELLTAGEAVLITKPTADLANLIEWDLREGHWHLRRDLAGFHRAMYAADLVHHLVQDRDPHPETYRLLKRFLEELADSSRGAGALLRFQWGLIEDLGFQPILDRDAGTGRRL